MNMMSLGRWALAWLALVCAGTATTLAGTNLILNPGFEEGESPLYPGVGLYWETNDGQPHPQVDVLTNATQHSGEWSQWLQAHSTWDLGMVRQVTGYGSITPGRTYQISAWVKTANVYNPAGWYVFGIWWFHDDTWLGEVKMPQQETNNYDWREISWTSVAPTGANRVAALLTRHTDGHAWYDDVFIGEITPGAPAITRTPASFAHEIREGSSLPDDTFTVRNSGGGMLEYEVTDDAAWLSATPDSGTSGGELEYIRLHYEVSGLVRGTYSASVHVSDPDASNSPQTVSVQLLVGVPADLDHDGDVDQTDYGLFQVCYTGGGTEQNDPACAGAKLDGDLDVDYEDFLIFYGCMSGPGVQSDPTCDQGGQG